MKDIFSELYKKVLSFFNAEAKDENSKDTACNRLKLVLMQDRAKMEPALMEKMREEMVAVISKYVEIDKEALDLNLEAEGESFALMLNIPVIRAKTREEIEEEEKKAELLKKEASDEDSDEQNNELSDDSEENDDDDDDIEENEDEEDEEDDDDDDEEEAEDSNNEITEDNSGSDEKTEKQTEKTEEKSPENIKVNPPSVNKTEQKPLRSVSPSKNIKGKDNDS